MADKFEHLHRVCDDYIETRKLNPDKAEQELRNGFASHNASSEAVEDIVLKMDEEWDQFEIEHGNYRRSTRSVIIGWIILTIATTLTVLSFMEVFLAGRIKGVFFGFMAIGILGIVNGGRVKKESIHEGRMRRLNRRRWMSQIQHSKSD